MFAKLKNFFLENHNTRQTFIKNTAWLFVGEVLGRLLKLAIVIFATRKLGVEGWGVFSYAMAYVSIFFILGDFGINTFITKEMSKDNSSKYKYLPTAIIIRLFLLGLFFLTAVLIAPNVGKIDLSLGLVLVFAVFSVSESIREFAMSVNRSLQKMEVEGFSKILISLSITVIGIFLLIKNADPISLGIAYMVGSIISTFYILWSIRKELRGLKWSFSKENYKTIYSFSWPIVIMGFFGFLFSLDSIMLGQMKSASEVGLYAMGQRVIALTSIIPGFIASSLLPILSKYENEKEKSGKIFEKIMTIVLAVGIPLTVGGVFFSKEIVMLVFGSDYLAGGPVLQVLMISILATFPNVLLINLIFSKNLQKLFIAATSLGVLLNIGLNFWLIPKYGAVGAAASTVFAEIIIMATNWRRIKKFVPFSVIPKLAKIILATIIMAGLILLLKSFGINFILIIIVSIIIYIVLLKILKEPVFKEGIAIIKTR